MQLMRQRLFGPTGDRPGELTVYVDKGRRGVDVHVGNLACFSWQMVALIYEESEWSLASSPVWYFCLPRPLRRSTKSR